MNRRIFLKTSGLALVGSALTPNVFARMAGAGATGGKKVLVAIFQRGAVDGLNMIVPYGERSYYAARPSIAIPKNEIADLDGFFGAHPSLQSLMPYWKDRSLAIVHAAGSPDSTRSHFDAQDFMEAGTPGVKSTEDGFLARALATRKDDAPLRAVALSQEPPRILAGSSAIATADLATFANSASAKIFGSMYPEAFESVNILRSLRGRNEATYPRGPLANALKQIAQLIKSDVGLEVAFADVGGWDTHAGQGRTEGHLANNLRNFSDAIAAFAKDLGSRMGDVVLVTMSEFGRTVRENGNRGTDHGHATVMLALGGNVKGGKVYGKWPGLGTSQLFEGRDLAVTTDFRDVFGEVLTQHLDVPSLAKVFPRYQGKGLGLLGPFLIGDG
ncbi:MAG TPA: DUF1501 domain-containing protein [Thermoanaerobaculia bacterium]|nr:DUF1501 domain-containing protein [Thermoanaerobaculia bacterium]